MGDKAFVTPSVMKWARETANMTAETAAEKIGVTSKRLLDWEQGKDQPTIVQAKNAANVYRRPFALLMLPNPPYDFTPLRDFRRKARFLWERLQLLLSGNCGNDNPGRMNGTLNKVRNPYLLWGAFL